MATKVRISELPLVRGINDADVIVINEQNVISSGITLLDFTTGFLAQDLQITGDATFHGEVEINNDLEVNGETSFNNIVTFEEPVVFKNTITIDNFTGVNLDDLGDVEITTPQHLDTLIYNAPFQRWENDGDTYLRDVVQDITPQLGGPLDVNNQPIISQNGENITIIPDGNIVHFRGTNRNQVVLRIGSENLVDYIDLTVPQSSILTSYTLTLPGDPGTAGQVLATNGSGLLYWTTNQGSGSGGGGGTGGGIELTDLSVQELAPKGGGELTYNPGLGVFYFSPADMASVAGIALTDLSVNKLAPRANGDLTYDNTTGEFSFTPADLSDYITDLSAQKIGELSDVDDTGITTGQALLFDNATNTYKPGNVSLSTASISDLNDVDTTGVTDGQYLVYNDADGEWKPADLKIPSTIVYKGVCDLTKGIGETENDNVDPLTNEAGHFWINVDTAVGPIDASWVGLSGDAIGLEYVVYTQNDEYYILGKTGDLSGIVEVQGGDGIGVDPTPDATRPTVFLTDTGVTAGEYAIPKLEVNDKGQIIDIEEVDVDALLSGYAKLSGADFTGEISVNDTTDPDPANHVETFRVDLDGSFHAGELNYPNVDGTPGEVLTTDGLGNLYFDTAASSVHVSQIPPANPNIGDLWFDTLGGILYIWYQDADSSQWVSIGGSGGGGGASVDIGETPPYNPTAGDLWFDSEKGILFIYYTDVNSSQWVAVGGGGGGGSSDFQITVGPAPHSPADEGDMWVTPTYELFVYDGSWVEIAGAGGGVDIPSLPSLP
jgi:hypothetical protein